MTRAGAEGEPVEWPDLHGLVADAVAVGMDRPRARLATLNATALRLILLAEVEDRARTLLLEAHGDRVRAAELNADDWRRWHARR